MKLSFIQELNDQIEQKRNILFCCEMVSEVKNILMLLETEVNGDARKKNNSQYSIHQSYSFRSIIVFFFINS